jgi:hypothetical protein
MQGHGRPTNREGGGQLDNGSGSLGE